MNKPIPEVVLDAPPSLRVRLARPADAAYLYDLRINSGLNTHLSAPPSSVQAQAQWLEGYVQREAQGKEYYFVLQNRHTGQDCGTVRIYDLRENSFCWGSWILDSHKPRLAAIESALFVYDFGFGVLGYPGSHFDVRRGNERVIKFHERMGAQRTGETELDLLFILSRENLAQHLPELLALTSYKPVFLNSLPGMKKGETA